MPGPGGGSRGGGGGRGFGGGFGGGNRGGFGGGGRGFGYGGHYYHHRPHYHGGWFFGPRYYGGGGCLGGLLGLMIAPIILIAFAAIMLMSVFGSAIGSITTGGEIYYDENTYQDYANSQYAEYFGGFEDYEDGLVIVFAVEDVEYYDYAYIAWMGDNIDPAINNMFGASGTKFGNAIESSAINSGSYKYSLDSGIATVMRKMQEHITALDLDSSYTCSHDYSTFDSRLVNKTELDVTPDTVNSALTSFTEATGIPVIVVIEDAEEILPKHFDYFSVIIATVLIVIAIVLIVKAVKSNKSKKNDDGSYQGNNNNGYNNNNYNGNNNNYNNDWNSGF
jgi:uncharacterized membrane protein